MRTLTALVSATAVVVGLGGGAAAYQIASAPGGPATSEAGHSARPAARPAPGMLFRWAPCRPPAVRQGDACVTEVVRTVVRPAQSAPGGASADDEQAGPVEDRSDDHSDDQAEDRGEDWGEDHADEQADDHGEDEADEESGDGAEDHGEDAEDEVEHEDEPGD